MIALILLLLWVFFLNTAGFLTASVLFMLLLGLFYEPVKTKRNLIRDGITAAIFAAGMFALFTALGISFPRGWMI